MDSDFKQIVLTFYERRTLKKSRKPDVPVGKCLCLLRHGLVIEKNIWKAGRNADRNRVLHHISSWYRLSGL